MCFASGAGMTPALPDKRKTGACTDHHHTRPQTTTYTNEKDDDDERWMAA